MTDRTCLRGCRQRGVHWANCPNYGQDDTCTGCAPVECRDGSLICDKCFGRMRGLLGDLGDLIARVRSIIDPLKANPFDQLRVRITATDVPAAVPSDPLDALLTLNEVQGVWWSWREDLTAICNNLETVTWLGGAVLDRHPAVDGLRPAWSVQDAVDQWGVERRTTDTYVFPVEDSEEVVGPVPEWGDRLLLKHDAEREAGSARTLRRWVNAGLIEPEARLRVGRVMTPLYRYSRIVMLRGEMRAREEASQYRKQEQS